MKGGRTAPRNYLLWHRHINQQPASMKGGRTAPRNKIRSSSGIPRHFCFNEGGADCPPKLAGG